MFSVPVPGSVVKVVTKYRNPGYGVISQDEFVHHHYEGEVTKPEKYYAPTEFGLTTDDASFPVRRIDISRVVRVEYHSGMPAPMPRAVERTEVKGSKGNTYIITNDNGKLSCTCTGFQYRSMCKHISQLR